MSKAIRTLVIAGVLAGTPGLAGAYEFQVRSRTVGQGYTVRWLRPGAEDLVLNRRRFSETLDLAIWDLLEPGVDPADPERPRESPFQLSLVSQVRIDHDYGSWLSGDVTHDEGPVRVREPALDVVPELGEQHLALDIPYAYLLGRGLFGHLDFQLGRQLVLDPLDFYAFDGLMVRWHAPLGLALEVHGGLLVRGTSAWASSRWDPDGTSDAGCERVEVGGDSWIPADGCSQRGELMPGFGAALATDDWSWLDARVAWRRAMSRTSTAFPEGAPGWGVNQDLLSATVRMSLAGGHLVPAAWARDNLGLGEIDSAGAEVRLGLGAHALTPGVDYTRPSFDLDSIFNVFASEPATELYARYSVGQGAVAAHARLSLRRLDAGLWSRAAATGLRWRRVRLDLYGENGEGGRRGGVDLAGRGALDRRFSLEGRATLLGYDEPRLGRVGQTLAMQGGALWIVSPGLSLQLVGEYNVNRYEADQLRFMAIMDLTAVPDL